MSQQNVPSPAIQVRGLTIGEGKPKIIVPLVGTSGAQVLEQARRAAREPGVDAVEWRVDCFGRSEEPGAVLRLLNGLRGELGAIPLLFTFRTRQEGGSGMLLSKSQYYSLNLAAAESGAADLIDVELSAGEDVSRHIAALKERGVLVIGSRHDFHTTPADEQLTAALELAWAVGADLPKLAVMPRTPEDVERLLAVTRRLYHRSGGRPFITISMGELGMASRLYGEVFGSAMTFGALGRSSAPGQMPVGALCRALERIHQTLGETI